MSVVYTMINDSVYTIDNILSLEIFSQIRNCSNEEKAVVLQLVKTALKLRNLS